MRILALDNYGGDGMLDLCMRWQDDGHDVRWFFAKTERTKDYGKGLVQVVDDWRDWMRWADIVVMADNTKYLREIDAWRKKGIPIIGASVEAAEWELNRTLGQDIFKKNKIDVPPYKEFNDYDAAIAHVKKHMTAFVSKPCGNETDKSLSYVAKTPADLIYMLQRWKKAQKLKGSFILQEKVSGCEMAVGGWFGPGGFLPDFCENFEFKKLMVGDHGPATGEMGTVVRYVKSSRLADKVLRPLAHDLDAMNYCGYVDVNCIIDEKGTPWPLEFTMRPGWPTFNIQMALLEGDSAQWLEALANGRVARPWKLGEVAAGVVMALPDFPYSHATKKEVTGVPIYGVTPSLRQRIHPCEIMSGEAPVEINGKIVNMPMWVSAGDYLLVATGTGATVSAAARRAYRVLDKLELPNSPFFRTDIGKRLKKQIPEIQARGYASGLQY